MNVGVKGLTPLYSVERPGLLSCYGQSPYILTWISCLFQCSSVEGPVGARASQTCRRSRGGRAFCAFRSLRHTHLEPQKTCLIVTLNQKSYGVLVRIYSSRHYGHYTQLASEYSSIVTRAHDRLVIGGAA